MNKYQEDLELELKVIQEISEGIVGFLDLDDLIKQVLEKLVQTLGYTLSGLMMVDKSGKFISLRHVELPKNVSTIMGFGLGFSIFDVKLFFDNKEHIRNFCLLPLIRKEVVVSEKFADFSHGFIGKKVSARLQQLLRIKLLVGLPILARGEVLGVLIVGTRNTKLVTQATNVLKTFASQISIAIFNAHLFAKVQTQVVTLGEQAEDLDILHDVSTFAESSLEKEHVVQGLLDLAPEKLGHLGVTSAALFLESGKSTVKVGGYTKSKLTDMATKLVLGKRSNDALRQDLEMPEEFVKIFKTKDTLIVKSLHDLFPTKIRKSIDKAIKKLNDSKFYALMPILRGGVPIGVIMYSMKITEEEFQSRQREILGVYANHVSIAIENADLYRQLSEQLKRIEKQSQDLSVANEKLKILDKAKSEFISIASHQLRTPLTVIKGYVSMLEDGSIGQIDDMAKSTIGKVGESAQRLVDLVNDLLDISRIEKGKMIYDKAKVSIEDLTESVFNELEQPAHNKELEYKFTKPKRALAKLFIDERKVRQVILNLIDNSIKYTPSGYTHVDVTVKGKEVIVAVTDTGVGLEPGEAERLFKKFQRGAGISVINTEGVGLGLFVAKKIIEAHDGKIWAESQGKGKGSTFAFSLPLKSKVKK